MVRFCLSESESNKEICDSDKFWRLKYARDYPDLFYYHDKNGVPLRHPKNAYMRTFSNYRKTLEEFFKKHSVPEEEVDNLYKSYKANRDDYSSRVAFVKKYSVRREDVNELLNNLQRIDGYYLRYGSRRRGK